MVEGTSLKRVKRAAKNFFLRNFNSLKNPGKRFQYVIFIILADMFSLQKCKSDYLRIVCFELGKDIFTMLVGLYGSL